SRRRSRPPASRADALSPGVVQRVGAHIAADPVSEDVDRDLRSRLRLRDRDVRIRDAGLDRVAVAAARHAADDLVAVPDRLRTDRARILEDDADELLPRLGREQRIPSDEAALVQLHGEAEAGVERGRLRREVARPRAVTLLEPERLDRAVAAGRHAVDAKRVPERRGVLGGAVQLPAELADVRDA